MRSHRPTFMSLHLCYARHRDTHKHAYNTHIDTHTFSHTHISRWDLIRTKVSVEQCVLEKTRPPSCPVQCVAMRHIVMQAVMQ